MRVWSCCELRETRGILAPRRLTHHEKEEEGEKELEEDLVLVEVVEHSWEVGGLNMGRNLRGLRN